MPVTGHLLSLCHGQVMWLVVAALDEEADEAQAADARDGLGVV